MSKKNNKGINYGILSGMLWGLDTVLTGFILSTAPFISNEKAILIAPIISAYIFKHLDDDIFRNKKGLNKTNKIIKN